MVHLINSVCAVGVYGVSAVVSSEAPGALCNPSAVTICSVLGGATA